ncbi:MAG: hypothetical protein RLZZ290_1283 [Pseudomonadota bacterium]
MSLLSIRTLATMGILVLGALSTTLALAAGASLTFACGASANDQEYCVKHAQEWAKATGNQVKTISVSQNPIETLALFRQLFAAKSPDVDVIMMDVVWPGVIQKHLLDLKPYSKGAELEHFSAMVENMTVGGRLVGMPWYTDAGLLYYRKDLLEKYGRSVPKTWSDLIETAEFIQQKERAAGRTFHGYVFQGRAYEGLTCNAMEWVASHQGGSVVKPNGEIDVRNTGMMDSLNMARSLVTRVSPPGVLNYNEEDSRGVFQNGNALFMRNWPYAWGLMNKGDSAVRGRVGVAALPAGGQNGRPAATLGGWSLGVSKYSRYPQEAADLVLYMTSAKIQKKRAIQANFNPTRPALYLDPEIERVAPFMIQLRDVFASAVARPSTVTATRYPRVSQQFWDAVHAVISGRAQPEDAMRRLEGQLHLVKRQEWR